MVFDAVVSLVFLYFLFQLLFMFTNIERVDFRRLSYPATLLTVVTSCSVSEGSGVSCDWAVGISASRQMR